MQTNKYVGMTEESLTERQGHQGHFEAPGVYKTRCALHLLKLENGISIVTDSEVWDIYGNEYLYAQKDFYQRNNITF